MNKIKAFIPNALTLGNLLCGCMAIILLLGARDYNLSELKGGLVNLPFLESSFALGTRYQLIIALVFASMLLDFFDGFVARALNVQSEIGKQLDSLADMVTFGVLPSLMLFFLFTKQGNLLNTSGEHFLPSILGVFCLLVALGACYRLAKFNIDTEQSVNFKGLATPAMTLFVIGYFNVAYVNPSSWLNHQVVIVITSLLLMCLMNINTPLFSLKIKNISFKSNWFRYVLLIASIVLFVVFKLSAFAIIIPLYIMLSIITRKNFA